MDRRDEAIVRLQGEVLGLQLVVQTLLQDRKRSEVQTLRCNALLHMAGQLVEAVPEAKVVDADGLMAAAMRWTILSCLDAESEFAVMVARAASTLSDVAPVAAETP